MNEFKFKHDFKSEDREHYTSSLGFPNVLLAIMLHFKNEALSGGYPVLPFKTHQCRQPKLPGNPNCLAYLRLASKPRAIGGPLADIYMGTYVQASVL